MFFLLYWPDNFKTILQNCQNLPHACLHLWFFNEISQIWYHLSIKFSQNRPIILNKFASYHLFLHIKQNGSHSYYSVLTMHRTSTCNTFPSWIFGIWKVSLSLSTYQVIIMRRRVVHFMPSVAIRRIFSHFHTQKMYFLKNR